MLVRESISFQRNRDPKQALGVGIHKQFRDSNVREICFDIASTVQTMLEGDDVDFEPISDEEREKLENELGWNLDDLADSDNLEDTSPENVYNIYSILISHGYLN